MQHDGSLISNGAGRCVVFYGVGMAYLSWRSVTVTIVGESEVDLGKRIDTEVDEALGHRALVKKPALLVQVWVRQDMQRKVGKDAADRAQLRPDYVMRYPHDQLVTISHGLHQYRTLFPCQVAQDSPLCCCQHCWFL